MKKLLVVTDFLFCGYPFFADVYHCVLVTEQGRVLFSSLVILPPVLFFELDGWLESCAGLRRLSILEGHRID